MDLPQKVDAEGREVMQECAFDIKISDSDFELHDEVVGACVPEDGLECPETDATEDGDPSKPRGSGMKSLTDTDPNIGSGGEGGNDRNSLNQAVPGSGPNSKLEDQVYIGLPPPGSQKHYRTDYPAELRLKKVCSPKHSGKRKTVDNYRTQAVATFTPVASEETILKQGPTEKDATGGSKNQDASKSYTASVKTKEKQCKRRVRDLPPIVSVSDEEIIDYLEDNNIQMMLEYFLGLCVIDAPDDPFQYIADLASKLIEARTNDEAFEKLPRLLTTSQVESLFRVFDRVGTGYIDYPQYQNIFSCMGLVRFNEQPNGFDTDKITMETFVTEGNNAINELLRSFMIKTVRAPDDC